MNNEIRISYHLLCHEIYSFFDFFLTISKCEHHCLSNELHRQRWTWGVGGDRGTHCVWAGTMKAQREEAAATWAGAPTLI